MVAICIAPAARAAAAAIAPSTGPTVGIQASEPYAMSAFCAVCMTAVASAILFCFFWYLFFIAASSFFFFSSRRLARLEFEPARAICRSYFFSTCLSSNSCCAAQSCDTLCIMAVIALSALIPTLAKSAHVALPALILSKRF